MGDKIVVVDFVGTLIKKSIIEEANQFRAQILERSTPTSEEYAHKELLFKVNNEFVEKLTGITPDMRIVYKKNDLRDMVIPGDRYQNMISTNLFQIGMYLAAKKHGQNMFPADLLAQLHRIQEKGYKLALVSGVRTDIISGMLQIAHCPIDFDFIYGQPPVLGLSNETLIKKLMRHGTITHVIGDKQSDLDMAPLAKAKSIFVGWGHPQGAEQETADTTIWKPAQLEKVFS